MTFRSYPPGRKPHRKGSKKLSPTNILAQDPGPVPNDPSHIRLNYPRVHNISSTNFVCDSPVSLSDQTKGSGS
jgi:hypothetical protein